VEGLAGKLGAKLSASAFQGTDEITIEGENERDPGRETFRAVRGSPINLRPAQPLSFEAGGVSRRSHD
jgi:hypothetical protein